MGKAIRYFREATSDIQREILDNANEIKKEVDITRDATPKDQPDS